MKAGNDEILGPLAASLGTAAELRVLLSRVLNKLLSQCLGVI